MALGTNPSFATVRAFFNGPANLASYRRGGGVVPDIPANAAISTTIAGLRLSQFSGADKVSLPPAPTISSRNASAYTEFGSCSAEIAFRTNGTLSVRENGGAWGAMYTWLPSGRSASEYQVRTSPDGVTWGSWLTISSDIIVSAASAYTDGFYSDYQSSLQYAQIGAQGTALSNVAEFLTEAQAVGRG